jgi:hypothetical protein
MKKIKILTILFGVACCILLIILFSLLKEKKERFNFSIHNKLLNTMSYSIKDKLLNEYVGGGIGEGYWEEQVDSMYFYLNKLKHSDLHYDYCNSVYLFMVSEKNGINNIIKSLDRNNTEEKEFVVALLEYLSLQSMLEMRLSNYFPFDRIIYNTVFPLKGDTINFGDEYVAAVPICCYNTEYKPTFVLDGDTIETVRSRNIFSEKTTKRGHIKKEGYITYFQFGEEQRVPMTIEYYVK